MRPSLTKTAASSAILASTLSAWLVPFCHYLLVAAGSTITQQLIKNSHLKNERTFLRKFVEMVLALELEKRISKSRILSACLCKIYWGHGIYGVKSASKLYFGKHPSLLTLGECALLVGMIPAPELRSPFRDYSRGKTFQARVLKRMVDGRFLDVDAALSAIRRSDSLKPADLNAAEHSLLPSMTGRKIRTNLQRDTLATVKERWEWERESCIWEVREEMEEWAKSFRAKEEFKKTNLLLLLPYNKDRLQLLLSVLPRPISLLK